MCTEFFVKHRLVNVSKERESGLHLDIQVLLRQLKEVVLGGVSKVADNLDGVCLLSRDKPHARLAGCHSQTLSERECLVPVCFGDAAAALDDCGLEQHLECVAHHEQDCNGATSIGGSIEVLNAEDERIDRIRYQVPCFLLHDPRARSPLGSLSSVVQSSSHDIREQIDDFRFQRLDVRLDLFQRARRLVDVEVAVERNLVADLRLARVDPGVGHVG